VSADEIVLLQHMGKTFGALFATAGAFFGFLEIWYNDDNDKIRDAFLGAWYSISQSNWLRLPLLSLRSFSELESYALIAFREIQRPAVVNCAYLLFVIIVLPLIIFDQISIEIFILCSTNYTMYIFFRRLTLPKHFFWRLIIYWFFIVWIGIWSLSLCIISIFTQIDNPWVLVVYMIFCLPVYSGLIALIIRLVADVPFSICSANYRRYMVREQPRLGDEVSAGRYGEYLSLGAISVSLSLMVTLLALSIGHAAVPAAHVPKTAQMLLSNVICDGLTIYSTFVILRFCLNSLSDFTVFFYVIVDLGVSAILACLSLYIGLVGTEHELGLRQVLRVLAGHSVDGARWEIGPYFWAMHTTFIPTALCMFFVLLAVTGKIICKISMRYAEVASAHKRPFALTSALCGVFVAFFAGAVVVTDMFSGH
jgi:hypothetical protein